MRSPSVVSRCSRPPRRAVGFVQPARLMAILGAEPVVARPDVCRHLRHASGHSGAKTGGVTQLREVVSTTAETLSTGPSPSRTSITTRAPSWRYVKSLTVWPMVSSATFCAMMALGSSSPSSSLKDAIGIVEVKIEPCHHERPADALLSGSISSCVENGLVRNAMHPEFSAAARTAGLSLAVI